MRRFIIILTLAVLAIAVSAQAQFSNSNSVVVNGVQYYTATDRAAYYSGDFVGILSRVTNLGTSDVTLEYPSAAPADYGAWTYSTRFWAGPPGAWAQVIRHVTLHPGAFIQDSTVWDQKINCVTPGWPIGTLVPTMQLQISAQTGSAVPGSPAPKVSVPITICKIGDFDCSGKRDIADINALWAARTTPGADPRFDLNGNGHVDLADATKLITYYIGTSMSDTNLDGCVDIIDLGTLAAWYGKPGRFADGDSNFNGVIDVIDLGNMANDYGKYFGSVPWGEPIPEPATLYILGLMAAAALRRRR
jgi:hypothetical protein